MLTLDETTIGRGAKAAGSGIHQRSSPTGLDLAYDSRRHCPAQPQRSSSSAPTGPPRIPYPASACRSETILSVSFVVLGQKCPACTSIDRPSPEIWLQLDDRDPNTRWKLLIPPPMRIL